MFEDIKYNIYLAKEWNILSIICNSSYGLRNTYPTKTIFKCKYVCVCMYLKNVNSIAFKLSYFCSYKYIFMLVTMPIYDIPPFFAPKEKTNHWHLKHDIQFKSTLHQNHNVKFVFVEYVSRGPYDKLQMINKMFHSFAK